MQMTVDEAILERLSHFDDDQKRRLLAIVDSWNTPATVEGVTLGELADSGLVGIWADRDDIGDSVEFARDLRRRIDKT